MKNRKRHSVTPYAKDRNLARQFLQSRLGWQTDPWIQQRLQEIEKAEAATPHRKWWAEQIAKAAEQYR
jgi:hypothetical protein